MMQWEIKPRVGIGDILFGDRPEEILDRMGHPDFVESEDDELRYMWNENPSRNIDCVFHDNKLCEFDVSKRNKFVILFGTPIFENVNIILDELKAHSQKIYLSNAVLIADDLALTLTGFHDGAEEDRAITAYKPGRWDFVIKRSQVWYEV